MAAIGVFEANVGKTDVGKTIFYSVLIGLPIAIIAGPIFGKFIAGRVCVPVPDGIASQLTHESGRKSMPGFALTILTILLPVLLMLSATIADITLVAGHPAREWIDLLAVH